MSDTRNWVLPEELRAKPDELDFDLARTLDAVVALRAEVPEDAYTASILGTERGGNGVVIGDDGLVLTIGYLITEAQQIWLSTNSGEVVAAHALAYDFATGFGLVQPLGALRAPVLKRGSTSDLAMGDDLLVVSHGGQAHALKAKLAGKREFAGYWEYLLDEALFTAPAHPDWSGAALVGDDGRLLGIGSLLVQAAADEQEVQGNMFVPIDILEPILQQLLTTGSAQRPSRPWLGMYSTETNGQLVVSGVAPSAPAERAGIQAGDVILAVGKERVSGLADFLRKLWRAGADGKMFALTLGREGGRIEVRLRGANRSDFLKKPRLH